LSPDSFADQTSLSFQPWVVNHKGVCILHVITNWMMLHAQKPLHNNKHYKMSIDAHIGSVMPFVLNMWQPIHHVCYKMTTCSACKMHVIAVQYTRHDNLRLCLLRHTNIFSRKMICFLLFGSDPENNSLVMDALKISNLKPTRTTKNL